LDERFNAIAATQLGLATVEQALAIGFTRPQIRRRVARDQWEWEGREVLAVCGAPRSWERALLGGLLELGEASWVSHRAVAALFGFDGFPRVPVEFTVLRDRRFLRSELSVHTTRRLESIDRHTLGQFRCVSATRTVLDLARDGHVDEVERALDGAVRGGWSSPAFAERRLAALRGKGRAGVRLLEQVLIDAGGHSWLERRFLELVRRAGLPRPRCQAVFARNGTAVARVDFHFEPEPLVVEVSGRRGHSTDLDRQRDAHRRNELQYLGRVVVEFTSGDLRRRPDAVVRVVREHLHRLRSGHASTPQVDRNT
jgi:hypothetical protein